jgi:hypothetical protein
MKRSWSGWLAFASLTVVTLSGVLAARPRYGGMVRVELQSTLRTADPADWPADATQAAVKAQVLRLIFDTLVGLDQAGRAQPRLATSWHADPSGRRWEFRLRPAVRLHDGSQLDAGQVAAALHRANPAWAVAADGENLAVESASPVPDLLWELADARNVIAVPAGPAVLGTGPFRVERWEAGRQILLRAHDLCWEGRPFLDAVQIDLGRTARDQLADLELGHADIVSVLPQDVRRLSQRGLRVVTATPPDLIALVVDPSQPAASDDARRALAMSVDRESICSVLLQRQAEPARALLPQSSSGYAFLFAREEDRAQARSIGRSLPIGSRTWALQFDTADPVLQAVAERIVVDARDAGLTLSLAAQRAGAVAPAVRLLRVPLSPDTPDRVMARVAGVVRLAVPAALPDEPVPSSGAGLEALYRYEQSIVGRHTVVPLVHLSRLFGVSARVASWHGPFVLGSGGWNLADAWLRGDRP